MMTVEELRKELVQLGVKNSAYSICSEIGNEQYCLESAEGKWYYFYSERGQRSGEKIFQDESEACEFFLSLLKDDPTVNN
jgi:hypothetical protein